MPGTAAGPSPSGTWSPAASAFNSSRGNPGEKRLLAHVAFHRWRFGSRWLSGAGLPERDSRLRAKSPWPLAHPFQWRRHLAPPGRQSSWDPRRVVASPVALLASTPPWLDRLFGCLRVTTGAIDLSVPIISLAALPSSTRPIISPHPNWSAKLAQKKPERRGWCISLHSPLKPHLSHKLNPLLGTPSNDRVSDTKVERRQLLPFPGTGLA